MPTPVTTTVDFPSPYWDAISEDARTLVAKMLSLNPTDRPSCEDVLTSKWLLRRRCVELSFTPALIVSCTSLLWRGCSDTLSVAVYFKLLMTRCVSTPTHPLENHSKWVSISSVWTPSHPTHRPRQGIAESFGRRRIFLSLAHHPVLRPSVTVRACVRACERISLSLSLSFQDWSFAHRGSHGSTGSSQTDADEHHHRGDSLPYCPQQDADKLGLGGIAQGMHGALHRSAQINSCFCSSLLYT